MLHGSSRGSILPHVISLPSIPFWPISLASASRTVLVPWHLTPPSSAPAASPATPPASRAPGPRSGAAPHPCPGHPFADAALLQKVLLQPALLLVEEVAGLADDADRDVRDHLGVAGGDEV